MVEVEGNEVATGVEEPETEPELEPVMVQEDKLDVDSEDGYRFGVVNASDDFAFLPLWYDGLYYQITQNRMPKEHN